MREYETIIHIITKGKDEYDAGEKAGQLIDLGLLEPNMVISCEPTRSVCV